MSRSLWDSRCNASTAWRKWGAQHCCGCMIINLTNAILYALSVWAPHRCAMHGPYIYVPGHSSPANAIGVSLTYFVVYAVASEERRARLQQLWHVPLAKLTSNEVDAWTMRGTGRSSPQSPVISVGNQGKEVCSSFGCGSEDDVHGQR